MALKQTSVRHSYWSGIVAPQHNDSIKGYRLLLPSPIMGEGLGMRAIELRLNRGRLEAGSQTFPKAKLHQIKPGEAEQWSFIETSTVTDCS